MSLSLNFNEKVIFGLRTLYLERGYSQYKMSKFEEYDLYARNKDFLISDSVITFTDTNGKLMALKPDVTLSIIKNIKDQPLSVQKVYYNENVYRISKGSQAFKEIMQVGLECFGDIDAYNICEVLTLAAESLNEISKNFILDISHLGIIAGIINSLEISSYANKNILRCIGEKNTPELIRICNELNISKENAEILRFLVTNSGKAEEVLPSFERILENKVDITPIRQLREIILAINANLREKIRIDFSVVSDMKYYNGIVFKGFIEGVPTSVLSGGQYDKLMKKMNRKSGAIGFAVYLDMLERLNKVQNQYDVDILLLYTPDTDLTTVNSKVSSLTAQNKKVFACKEIPDNIKYRQIIKLDNSEVDNLEGDA